MAAPIVSGIVADLLQLHPTWTPTQVKGALVHTLRNVANGAAKEVNADAANKASAKQLNSNQGVKPSQLLMDLIADAQSVTDSTATGTAVDDTRSRWSRSSWSRSSWSIAPGNLSASWSRSSWSCNCSRTESGEIDPTRSSWSRSSWSTVLGL
jgi:serine protease AprX